MCVGMPTYSTEKERMALLGADQLLLQWLTELVSVTAWAAGTGGSPGRFGYLGTLAILGGGSPRQLLSAVPQTMTIIANVMWEMTAGTSAVNDQVGHLLIALTDVLKDLAFVDSRGFRRLEGLAGTLAAVEAISCAHLELNMNSSGFLENIVELVKVLTPVAASINESPGGLALFFVSWPPAPATRRNCVGPAPPPALAFSWESNIWLEVRSSSPLLCVPLRPFGGS